MKTAILTLFALACALTQCQADLIHYYSFDADVSDAIGSANGVLQNGATVNGGTLVLDGANDFVQFGEKIVPFSGDYTIAFFARETSPSSMYVELISQGSSQGPGFYIGYDPSDIIRVGDSWLNTGVVFPSDGAFHHFALSVDSVLGESRLYLDGTLVATAGHAVTSTSGGNNTRFGRQFDGYDEYFGGEIDEMRIYDHTLDLGEVAAIANPVAVVAPDSLTLFRGFQIGGTLEDVFESDDSRMRFNPGFTLNSTEAPVWLIFDAALPNDNPAGLEIVMEAQAGTPGLTGTLEAWNWTSEAYDVFDVSAASFNNDTIISVDLSSGISDYVETGTAAIRTRVGWRKTGLTINYPWEVRLDQLVWVVEE